MNQMNTGNSHVDFMRVIRRHPWQRLFARWPMSITTVVILTFGALIGYMFLPNPFIGVGILLGWITLIVFFSRRIWIAVSGAIGFSCPYCGKHIGTDEPWICGYCDNINKPRKRIRSIIYGCSRPTCERIPHSYRCYHCGRAISLDADHDTQHPARAADRVYPNTPQEPEPVIEYPDDPLDARVREAEKRREAARKRSRAVEAEAEAMEAEQRVRDQEAELDKMQSSEFREKMNPVQAASFADAEIIKAGFAEEERIKNDPDIPAFLKSRLIDRVKIRVKGMLDARKPR
jgi:predicted nucleic acid-binding Zn ribbon protein